MKPIVIPGCIHAAQLDDNSVITITPQIGQFLVSWAPPVRGEPQTDGWTKGYYYDNPSLVMPAFLCLAIGEEPEGWTRKTESTPQGTKHTYPTP
jgi:hypothetical protein